MAKNFSDLATEYSTNKQNYNDIRNNIGTIMSIREEILRAEANISYHQKNLEMLESFKNYLSEDEYNDTLNFCSDQIRISQDIIRLKKEDTLYKTQEQIEQAKSDLNAYIKAANTNPEFKKEIRRAIIEDSKAQIMEKFEQRNKKIDSVSIIEKLEAMSNTDAELKTLLSIDKEKSYVQSLEGMLNNHAIQNNPDRKKAFQETLNDYKAHIAARKSLLQTYILNNKDALGLPDIDATTFTNPDSPLAFISDYTDPNNANATLANIKAEYQAEIAKLDKSIEMLDRNRKYAREDIREIEREEQEDSRDYNPGMIEKIFEAIYNFGHGILNLFKGKPFRDSSTYRAKIIRTPKVVDNDNHFADARNTELGKDAYQNVLDKYKVRTTNIPPVQRRTTKNRKTTSRSEHGDSRDYL